jgi:hypothetical protein
MKNVVFLDVLQCGSCRNQRFGGTPDPTRTTRRNKLRRRHSPSPLYRPIGRQLAKLVPNFADIKVSRVQCNGYPRPLISVFENGGATFLNQ